MLRSLILCSLRNPQPCYLAVPLRCLRLALGLYWWALASWSVGSSSSSVSRTLELAAHRENWLIDKGCAKDRGSKTPVFFSFQQDSCVSEKTAEYKGQDVPK